MSEKTKKNEILNYVNFSLCVLLSFGGCFFTLAKLGEIRTLFIVIAFAVANAFVKTKWYLKVACFFAFGYVMHSFYGEGFGESLTCALFCAFVMLAAIIMLGLAKRKKSVSFVFAIVLIMSTFRAHVVLFGSPFSAFAAKDSINGYIEKNYLVQSIEKSEVRFDRRLGCFVCDINSVTEPTEIFTVSLRNGRIYDTFRDHLEISLMKGKRLEIVTTLRKAFPNESFTVKSDSIQGFHLVKAGITDTEDRSKRTVFDIYITAYLTQEDFASKAVAYTDALLDAGIDFGKINFYGGRAGNYYRRLTLIGERIAYNKKPEFVPYRAADLAASRLINYDLPGLE